MKNFHYVDEKGKDQGINGTIYNPPFLLFFFVLLFILLFVVRSRAKELAELLGDVENIKAERKKAKKNRNKYTGVGSEGGMSFSGGGAMSGGGGGGGGSGRYEGFGSESNYSSGGGGGSGANQSSFGNSGNDFFDDERPGRYDDFDSPASQRRGSSKSSRTMSPPAATTTRKVSDAKPKQKTAKELNLFDFDEPVVATSTSKGKSNDDDWGDFAGGDANGKKISRFFFFCLQLLIFLLCNRRF